MIIENAEFASIYFRLVRVLILLCGILTLSLNLTGCPGAIEAAGIYAASKDDDDDDGSEGSGTRQGQLVDSPVAGVEYLSTPSQKAGITNAKGFFSYLRGDTTTFRIGGIVLGSTQSARIVTLKELTGGDEIKAVNMTRFLLTLDEDMHPDNGTQIPVQVRNAASEINGGPEDFDEAFESTMAASFAQTIYQEINGEDRNLVSEPEAKAHYECTQSDVADGRFDNDCGDGGDDGQADGSGGNGSGGNGSGGNGSGGNGSGGDGSGGDGELSDFEQERYWTPIPELFRSVCQSANLWRNGIPEDPPAPNDLFYNNATIPALRDSLELTKVDVESRGQQGFWSTDSPDNGWVPAGRYIGDLTFMCTYIAGDYEAYPEVKRQYDNVLLIVDGNQEIPGYSGLVWVSEELQTGNNAWTSYALHGNGLGSAEAEFRWFAEYQGNYVVTVRRCYDERYPERLDDNGHPAGNNLTCVTIRDGGVRQMIDFIKYIAGDYSLVPEEIREVIDSNYEQDPGLTTDAINNAIVCRGSGGKKYDVATGECI